MKSGIKIALGVIAGGSLLIAAGIISKPRKNKSQTFTAPDGNTYREDEMYRNSQGEIYQNGKKLHFDTPELLSQAHHHIDSQLNLKLNNKNFASKQVNYHQKGIRHH
jgi:hypothetical protein